MHLLRVYQCLGDTTRIRVLNLLTEGPLCVCHFEAVLSLPQARVSRHLAYLKLHGVVTCTRSGPWRVYALKEPIPAVLAANLACLRKARQTEAGLQRDIRRLRALSAHTDCGCTNLSVPRRQLLRIAR